MTRIREFNLNSSELLSELYEILTNYPSIQWQLQKAKMEPLMFLSKHNVSDCLIEKLLPDAAAILNEFYNSSYCERIFSSLKDNRFRKSTTNSKTPKPFERVRRFRTGSLILCEENTYKYYKAIFGEVDGVDWFPVWICGLLIVAQNELVNKINASGEPLAPFVYECIETVINPLLSILAYEDKVLLDSSRHKEKSLSNNVRRSQAPRLKRVFKSTYKTLRDHRGKNPTFKEMIIRLERENEIVQEGRLQYLDRENDDPVKESTLRSWLTECNNQN